MSDYLVEKMYLNTPKRILLNFSLCRYIYLCKLNEGTKIR